MKQKTMKMCKHISIMMLTIMLSVFAISGADKLGKVYAGTSFGTASEVGNGDECTYEKNSDTKSYYKVVLAEKSFLQFINYNSIRTDVGDKVQIIIYSDNNSVLKTYTQNDAVSGTYNSFTITSDDLDAGTYYFSVARSQSDIANSGKVKLTINPSASNTDSNGAEIVDMPVTGTVVKTWKDALVNNAHRKMYYTLNVTDKAYYDFRDSSATITLYEGTTEEYSKQLASASELNYGEILLPVGKYLLTGYGHSAGSEYNVTIKCRDFMDIKSIAAQERYEVLLNSKSLIAVAYTPATGYESSIKWTSSNQDCMEITDYDYNEKSSFEDKSKAIIYAKKLGEYTSTITTGEGVSKTITVMVKPNPTKVSEATATTSSKSKASLNISWKGDGNYYIIYEKSGSDFKVVAQTASTNYTFNKAPGKTYSYKIESCYKVGDKIICSSLGDAVEVFTAPYKAPTIKSAKQKGKTKYTKPYTKRVKTWNSYWHWYDIDYVKAGNTSTATVKVSIKKVSGAKSYETGKGNSFSNTIIYSYKGKIKARKEKLKIRGIWKKGVTTAYGPYSKVKTVNIKGNK